MASGKVVNNAPFLVKRFMVEYTDMESNTAKAWTKQNFEYSVPEGYEVFSFNRIVSGSINAIVSDCNPLDPTRFFTIRNLGSSALSGTATVQVVFINTAYKESLGITS